MTEDVRKILLCYLLEQLLNLPADRSVKGKLGMGS